MFETEFQVTARLGPDGKAGAKVTALCSYGARQAGVTVEVEDEKLLAAIGSSLEKAKKSVEDDLAKQAMAGAAEALAVANRRGEKL